MKVDKPLVSLVVPTKNRYFYLKKLIQVVDSFENKDFIEFVIQDNSDDNSEFISFLNENTFSFLKYFYVKESMAISRNSDLAIRNSTCEYVSFIGDDDGVTRYIVDCVRWMKENDIECVVPDGFRYCWNDSSSKKDIISGGSLSYKEPTFRMKVLLTQSVLDEEIKTSFISRGKLPMLYHGIVKRSTLEKIWDTCGSYFPGASPDIANGVALCFVMEKFCMADFPFVYSGASKHLGGGAVKMKHRATDDFKSLQFLPKNIEEIWDKRIPKVWAGCTIWCESSVEAIKAMHQEEVLDKINYENLYVELVAYHYFYRELAFNLTQNKTALYMKSISRIFKHYFNAAIKLIKVRIFKTKLVDGIKIQSGLDDIIKANAFIESLCKHNGSFTFEYIE